MAQVFERQTLYEEVWREPLSTLGPKYNLSDNGLRKICRKLEIPLPPRGYWARKAAGQRVSVTPLRPGKSAPAAVTSSAKPRPLPDEQTDDDEAWLAGRLAWEKLPEAAVVYEPEPTRWHPLVKPEVALLRGRAKKLTADKARRDAAEARRASGRPARGDGPKVDTLALHFADHSGDQLVPRHHAAGLRTSPLTLDRALAVLNAVCWAAEARSCTVSYSDEAGRYELALEGAALHFSIRERPDFREVPHIVPSWRTRREAVPRDCLAIVMERARSSSSTTIVDKPGAVVETRLQEIFPKLYRFVVAGRREHRDEAAKQARLAIIRAENARAHEERMKIIAAREAEAARRTELVAEARRWAEAEEIRRYADRIERGASAGMQPNGATWIAWARRVADDIDPSHGRLVGFATVAPTDDPV